VTYTTSPYFLINAKKEVKTMEDLSGLKLRTVGGPPTEALKLLGGTPVMMPYPDTYIKHTEKRSRRHVYLFPGYVSASSYGRS